MLDFVRASIMLMSPEEFLVYPLSDVERAELVRGELRVTPPPGAPHALVVINLAVLLSAHVKLHGAGQVFADGAGYQLPDLSNTVRVPDTSFVRAGRLPKEGLGPGLMKLSPDLAVEVLSPSETASALEEKLDDFRACGTPLIWVIDPARRTVMIVASDAPTHWLREGDTLDGGHVLPGFTCAVTELFEGVAR